MNFKTNIESPKRRPINYGIESWYPYYAGFSMDFVHSILANAKSDACIVDPWNGSGTTTNVAYQMGLNAYGFDLNPVMVIAAKACLLPNSEKPSIKPLSIEIIQKAKAITFDSTGTDEPLNTWFIPSSSYNIRRIERAIQKILIDSKKYEFLTDNKSIDDLSCISSFYYVALFRTLRKLLVPFSTSNPTWVKRPKEQNKRLRPSSELIIQVFREEVSLMIQAFTDERANINNSVHIGVASSCASPLKSSVADYIITSPPYCTRIDYAVATMPELTLLGYNPSNSLNNLRRNLIGTSTVPTEIPMIQNAWGKTCYQLLGNINRHQSKASHSYYYKNHIQYFDSIYKSVSELSRILKHGGSCVLVVQDSYYKNVYNDLSQIVIEMAQANCLYLTRKEDFPAKRNMAGINRHAKKYRTSTSATESVIFLTK